MEHLVRVYNEKDRQTLEWLRRHVGDEAISSAVERCAGPDKPYLSAVCTRRTACMQPTELLAQHLAQQGRRTRWRLIALHASLAKPGREDWLDHQQPRGEPRLFVDLPGTRKVAIEAPKRC